jgi:hypothetical protein
MAVLCFLLAAGCGDPRDDGSVQAAGTPCSSDAQCASGACGVGGSGNCCAAACITGGCGATGCDGNGACVYPAGASVACPPSCSGGMLTASACDGAGACKSGTPAACPDDLACADATSCLGPQPVGAACTQSDQCAGGFCVDGYCCDGACSGACQACAASLTGAANGTCAAVSDGQLDPRGACGASANVCRAGECSGVPAVPAMVVAVAGTAAATVKWKVASANGAAIDSYIITGAGAPITVQAADVCTGETQGSACSYTIMSLTNCTAYTFTVAAHNVDGVSPAVGTAAVMPSLLPDAPSTPTLTTPATPGASMSLSWTAPGAQGCGVDDYDVYISGPASFGDHDLASTALSTTMSDLKTCDYPSGTCGSFYTFSVRAHTSGGWGPYSTGAAALPKVSYAADNVAAIWTADTCTSCHTSAQAPNLADAASAFANAAAEGALIYLCPEGASSSCSGHPVVMTAGNPDDNTLRRWVSDGNEP